jgi:HEPN domain-containing protein
MKTAVEWLQDTWLNYPDLCSYDKIQEWFKQAKEMEKEQIIEAYWDGYIKPYSQEMITEAEQYYKENFKSE